MFVPSAIKCISTTASLFSSVRIGIRVMNWFLFVLDFFFLSVAFVFVHTYNDDDDDDKRKYKSKSQDSSSWRVFTLYPCLVPLLFLASAQSKEYDIVFSSFDAYQRLISRKVSAAIRLNMELDQMETIFALVITQIPRQL